MQNAPKLTGGNIQVRMAESEVDHVQSLRKNTSHDFFVIVRPSVAL